MHDLVDDYAKAVADAIDKVREKGARAQALFNEALDHIAVEFNSEVALAAAKLEVGIQARTAAFRGETTTNVEKQAERDSEPYAPPVVAGAGQATQQEEGERGHDDQSDD